MTTSPFEPVAGPFVWEGHEMSDHPDLKQRLTETDLAELDRCLAGVRHIPPDEIQAEHVDLSALRSRLATVGETLERSSGLTRLRGLPVSDGAYDEDDLRRLFRLIGLCIGTPLSQSARGEQMFSVQDEGFGMGHVKARGPNTRAALSFHTDRCDVIGFLCVRQARSGGENMVVSSATVYNRIGRQRPDLLETLCAPFYYQRHNVDTGNRNPWCRHPVFAQYQGRFIGNILRVLIDRAYTMPELPDMTDRQREALDLVETVSREHAFTFRQEPGDLLFLNNFVTFHSRTAFEDEVTTGSTPSPVTPLALGPQQPCPAARIQGLLSRNSSRRIAWRDLARLM